MSSNLHLNLKERVNKVLKDIEVIIKECRGSMRDNVNKIFQKVHTMKNILVEPAYSDLFEIKKEFNKLQMILEKLPLIAPLQSKISNFNEQLRELENKKINHNSIIEKQDSGYIFNWIYMALMPLCYIIIGAYAYNNTPAAHQDGPFIAVLWPLIFIVDLLIKHHGFAFNVIKGIGLSISLFIVVGTIQYFIKEKRNAIKDKVENVEEEIKQVRLNMSDTANSLRLIDQDFDSLLKNV
jgi:hypothetical protein